MAITSLSGDLPGREAPARRGPYYSSEPEVVR
jgi:hypothetical protein